MVSISGCWAALICSARAVTSGLTPRLSRSMSIMATACSWCGIIIWANSTSALLKSPVAVGAPAELAELWPIGMPDASLSSEQPIRARVAARAARSFAAPPVEERRPGFTLSAEGRRGAGQCQALLQPPAGFLPVPAQIPEPGGADGEPQTGACVGARHRPVEPAAMLSRSVSSSSSQRTCSPPPRSCSAAASTSEQHELPCAVRISGVSPASSRRAAAY